jgi:hypothetical protein
VHTRALQQRVCSSVDIWHRNTKKTRKRQDDKLAVAIGTADEAQYCRVQVIKLCTKNYCDMVAFLRGLERFAPSAFAEVPDFFKKGLECSQHFSRIASDRTQEKIHERLSEIQLEGLICDVYTSEKFAELLAILRRRVEIILMTCIAYIGFTWRSGKGFDLEVARWANEGDGRYTPAITRRDGQPIAKLQDLLDLGFQVETLHLGSIKKKPNSHPSQVETLHRSAFAFNCRVLETELHRSFKHSDNRLWLNVGSGSYFLKEEDIQVRRS